MSDALFERFGRSFEVGHVLFREGEPGDVMFVLQSGTIRLTKTMAGEEKQLAMVGSGEFLGEMAILNAKPRTATATVVEGPVRCLAIDARMLGVMVEKNTEIAVRLMKELARRLDSANALIENLMHRDEKVRVVLALVRQAEDFGEATDQGIVVRTSAQDLAQRIGGETAVATQLMTRMSRLRLLKDLGEGRHLIPDLRRLEEFIQFVKTPK